MVKKAQNHSSSMLAYLSNIGGLGGELKQSAESFIVEEVMPDGTLLELDKPVSMPAPAEQQKFTHFVLQKRNWGTLDALRMIGKQLNCGIKRFSYAGMKDRNALTTQLAGIYAIPPERVLSVKIKDISINGAWPAEDKVRMGQLGGNRFTIAVEGMKENSEATVAAIAQDINFRFPNYFGEQRFGMRGNTHEVGAFIAKGDFKGAVLAYLCDSGTEENESSKTARARLKAEMNFAEAAKYFPQHLRYERLMIDHLSRTPTDFAGALRKLPRGLTLIFIHALQAHIFNTALSERISQKEITRDTPATEMGNLVGYESKPTETEKALLEEMSLQPVDFKLPRMPELGSKGTQRQLLAELQDFSFSGNNFRFTLGPGSYATTAMREFLDEKKN
jgi:tRNA pseudouridine13 synthase